MDRIPRARVIAGPNGVTLSHPVAGAIREGVNSWPRDAFTLRRLQDGSLTEAPAGGDDPETK